MSNTKNQSTIRKPRDSDINTLSGQKSIGFLPDIPFQRTIGVDGKQQRDKQNASSLNYRIPTVMQSTASTSTNINPLLMMNQQLHQIEQGGGGGSSNSSSPSTLNFRSSFFHDTQSKFMNKEFKNVRNYQHLYEKHMGAKLKGFQERERIGTKKVWLLEKLPPLMHANDQMFNNTLFSKNGDQGRNFMESLTISSSSVQNQQILKKIQRDQEGLVGINTILNRKSGDESTTASGNDLELVLNNTKPVLKKNLYHMGNNIIVTFKSIEITLIEEGEQGKQKSQQLIYVPPNLLRDLLPLTKNQLELKIMENISIDQNTGAFSYQKKAATKVNMNKSPPTKKHTFRHSQVQRTSSLERANKEVPDYFPEQIYTSIYVPSKHKDYKAIIKLPVIDYQLLSRDFIFLKTLSRSELLEYLDTAFLKWEDLLLKHLMSYRKFQELLKGSNPKQKQPSNSIIMNHTINNAKKSTQESKAEESDRVGNKLDVYVLNEADGVTIRKYSSIQEYQQSMTEGVANKLKGCFERDGIIGKIELKSFVMKVKGLNSEYEYKEVVKYDQWVRVIGFMIKMAKKTPENPLQIVDVMSECFLQYVAKGKLDQFSFKEIEQVSKLKGKLKKESKKKQGKTKVISQYFKYQKRSKILSASQPKGDRYLFELDFPQAIVTYENQEFSKQLLEADCEYLIEQDFSEWKRYLINQHFRIELNINSNEPLPRINEVKRAAEDDEEGIFSEEDFREKYPPKNEEEKKIIVETRAKLSEWFPY